MVAIILLVFVSAGFSACPGIARSDNLPDSRLKQEVTRHLERENYEEALALLAESWQEGPRTSEKAYLLGQVHRSLLRYPEARQFLEEALRLQPDYPEARLLLADTLIALDEPGRAEPHLQELQAAGYEPERTAFFQGLAASRAHNYSQAVQHFRLAQQDEQLAQDAKLQESLALAGLQSYAEARRTMQAAINLNPYTPTAALALGYVQALERRLQEVKRLRFRAAAGFAWDSNVTLQPGDPVAAALVSGAGDLVYTQLADLEFNFLPVGAWGIWGAYSYYQNFHRRLTAFDMMSHTAGLTPTYTWSNARFWLPFTYNYTDVGSHKYYTAFTLKPSYIHLFTPKWGLEGNVHLARRYYWFPVALSEDDRTGRVIGASLAGYYFVKNQQGFLQLRFTYERDFASGDNWDSHAYRLNLAVLYPVTRRFTVQSFADLAFQPYTNVFFDGTGTANPKRNDTILTLGFEGTYAIWKGLEVKAHYYYIRDDSNIALYDYRRHIIGGLLGYRY